jgi:hypothetical protein
MKYLKKMPLLFLVMALMITSSASAQSSPFAGTWKLKEKKLIGGKDFGNALAPFVTFSINGDSVRVKKAGDPTNIKIIYQTTDRSYLPGKRKTDVNDQGVTVQRFFNWLDGKKSWEMVTMGSKPGQPAQNDYQFKDIWNFERASDQLLLEMSFKSNSEPANFCTFKAIYERSTK